MLHFYRLSCIAFDISEQYNVIMIIYYWYFNI